LDLSDDKLLKESLAQLESAEKGMREVMERVDRARLVAYGKSNPSYKRDRNPDDPNDWRSMFFPPIANEWWELMNAEMSVEYPRFTFTARDASHVEHAKAAEDALDYYNDRSGFNRLFRLATRAATRDGLSVIKTIWCSKNQPLFGPDGSVIKDEDDNTLYKTVYEGSESILCKLEDVYPDPTATEFAKARFVFHRIRASTEDLHARTNPDGSKFYSNLDQLPESGGGESEVKRDDETEEAFRVRTEGALHTLHEKWTPHGRITIANRSVIIRRDDHPIPGGGIPFTGIRIIDDENSIAGVSPMNLVDHVQEAFWRVLNDTFDAMNLAISPPMLANLEEDPEADNYVIYPGAVLPTTNGEQTLKIMQDVAQLSKYDAFGFLSFLRELGEKITGMNSALSGNSEAATATQAAIDVRQGKGRVGYSMLTADDSWARVAAKSYALIQNFMSEEIEAVLTDGRSVSLRPDMLSDMMITPRPESSERSLKDLERQDSLGLLESSMGLVTDPTQLPQVNMRPIYERFFKAFNIEPDQVLPPAPNLGGLVEQAANLIPQSGGEADVLDEQGNPVDDHGISEKEFNMIAESELGAYGDESG